jgi:hypothetical protein
MTDMNRALIPMGALAAAGLVLLIPAPATVTRPVPDSVTPPELREGLRVQAPAGLLPMRPITGSSQDGPGRIELTVPEVEGWGGHSVAQGDMLTQPTQVVAPPSADRSAQDPLEMLGVPGSDLSAALVAPGMDAGKGWGWLSEDMRNMDRKALPEPEPRGIERSLDRPLPGDENDDPFDIYRRERPRTFRLDGGSE